MLQSRNSLRGNVEFCAALIFKAGVRDLSSHREQIFLNLREHRGKTFIFQERCGGPDKRIEFVNVTIGFDTIVVLADFGAVEQPRISAIARLGIDLHALSLSWGNQKRW